MHTERFYNTYLKKTCRFIVIFQLRAVFYGLMEEIITDLLLVIPTFIRVFNVIVMMSNFFKYLYQGATNTLQ